MGCSSSQTAPVWVLPWGAVLQEQAAPAWVSHGVTSPASKLAPGRGPFHGYGWISDPSWTSMGCRWTTCLTMDFITSCKGRLSAPVSRAPPLPPSSLSLVSAELLLSHRLTPLSWMSSHCSFFLPLLKYIITETLPLLLIGLALASSGSFLESAGTGCIRLGGSFSHLLTEATPIAPPLPKPCHTNPQHKWNSAALYVLFHLMQIRWQMHFSSSDVYFSTALQYPTAVI